MNLITGSALRSRDCERLQAAAQTDRNSVLEESRTTVDQSPTEGDRFSHIRLVFRKFKNF